MFVFRRSVQVLHVRVPLYRCGWARWRLLRIPAQCPWSSWGEPGSLRASAPCRLLRGTSVAQTSEPLSWPSPDPPHPDQKAALLLDPAWGQRSHLQSLNDCSEKDNLSSAFYLNDTFGGLSLVRAISSWAGLTSIPTTLVKCGAKSIVPWPEPQPTSTASPNCCGVYEKWISTGMFTIWDGSQHWQQLPGVSVRLWVYMAHD